MFSPVIQFCLGFEIMTWISCHRGTYMPRYRVGIDIGGTFTDFSVLDEHGGGVSNSKVLSTPADLTQGVMQALDDFFGNGRLPEDVSFLFHATTVATNALLERKGAKTWLLITEGFTGVYETPELGETRSGNLRLLDLSETADAGAPARDHTDPRADRFPRQYPPRPRRRRNPPPIGAPQGHRRRIGGGLFAFLVYESRP